MRSSLKIIVLTTMMASSGFSIEIITVENTNTNVTIDVNDSGVNLKEVKIKDGGVDRSIYIPIKDPNAIGTLSESVDDKLNFKKGLIIDFIDKNIDIDAFEESFTLKLKEKLQIGYYIFENKSELSDVELIEAILKSDSKSIIKTIRPNWELGVKKF